jgi:hypothetical protein
MNPNRTFKTLMVLILIYALIVTGVVIKPPAVTPVTAAAEIPEPEVKQGKYTIFQYTEVGWTNRLYATEFYIEDDKIFYKSREHADYLPIALENCLIVPEWIENVDELMNYGFWEPGGYE